MEKAFLEQEQPYYESASAYNNAYKALWREYQEKLASLEVEDDEDYIVYVGNNKKKSTQPNTTTVQSRSSAGTVTKTNNTTTSSKNVSYDHITHNVSGYSNSIDAGYVNAYMAETHPLSKTVVNGAEFLNKNVTPTFNKIQDGMSNASDSVGGFVGRKILSLFGN